jgi:hypothetical protein
MGQCSSKPPTQSTCIREVQLISPRDLLDIHVYFSPDYEIHLYVRNRSLTRVAIPEDIPRYIRSLKDSESDESFMHVASFVTSRSMNEIHIRKLWPGQIAWFNLGSLHKNWNLPTDYRGTLQLFFAIPVWHPFRTCYVKVKRRIIFSVSPPI